MKHPTREKDKLEAIKIVTKCASAYDKELAGRKLLFIYIDRDKKIGTCEMSFSATNFLHLTGLRIDKKRMGAMDFYRKCLKKRLSIWDFEFDQNGTTPLKLEVLPTLMCKNLSAKMIGDYNTRNPKLSTDKIAGSTRACIGFAKTGDAPEQYAPNTVLKGDLRDYVKDTLRVIAVYRRAKEQKRYEEMTYCAKKVQWDQITFPEEYAYLPKPAAVKKEEEAVTVI